MKKADHSNDLLTIGEFARLAGTTDSALRHYDSAGVFLPANRGKNNYRFYSPSQITTVKMIRVLSELDVPLNTVKELAKSRTPEMLVKLLHKHKEILTAQIQFLQDALSVIDTFTELLTAAIYATESELSVVGLPERNIILGDENDFSGETGYLKAFTRFCDAPHEPQLNTSLPIGGYFDSMDVFVSDPSRPTRFFSLDAKGKEKQPTGRYLVGYTRGYYGETKDLPVRMKTHAKKNGLAFVGPVFDIFLTDEISVVDPGEYLQQICVQVRETRRIPSRRPQLRF